MDTILREGLLRSARRAPLVVRVLDALPGPWWAWTLLVVSLDPLVAAAVESAYGRTVPSVGGLVVYSATCAIGGWATVWSWRRIEALRRQALAGKAAYTTCARDIYAGAIEPLRDHPDPETLDRQARRVSAAAEIKREVAAIQERPVDEGVLRAAAAISTSIVAAILARLTLSRVGL